MQEGFNKKFVYNFFFFWKKKKKNLRSKDLLSPRDVWKRTMERFQKRRKTKFQVNMVPIGYGGYFAFLLKECKRMCLIC